MLEPSSSGGARRTPSQWASRLPSVGCLIRGAAEHYGDRCAVSCGGRDLTFRELDREVEGLAASLVSGCGLRKGDRLALLLPNGVDLLLVYFAALRAGATVSPLDTSSSSREICGTLERLRPRALVTSPTVSSGLRAVDALSSEAAAALEVRLLMDGFQQPGWVSTTQLHSIRGGTPNFDALVSRADPALCPFSSGTTGKPKGIVLTHGNLLANVESLLARESEMATRHRVFGCPLPLHHVFPLTLLVLLPWALGAKVVLLERLKPQGLLADVETHGVSFFVGVPALFGLLAQTRDPASYSLPADMYWASGGAALSESVQSAFESKFRTELFQGYGLTETSPVVTWNLEPSRRDTVGRAVPGVELRVVDGGGLEVPPGVRGEVIVRGANVMRGYLDEPSETARAIRQGWFHTGDVGSKDQDGYLRLFGRRNEVITVGAEKFSPEEVDHALLEHPAVLDAAVKGTSDALRGQSVTAFIVRKDGASVTRSDIVRHCRERLSGYKVPKRVVFVSKLPRGAAGKVKRSALAP